MLGAQSVAKAFPEYPTTIVRVYPPALHLKDYISMAGPEIMTVGKSDGAQKTFLVNFFFFWFLFLQLYVQNLNKYASYPDWCISPHADHCHRPVCQTWLCGCAMHYQFFIFSFWGLTLASKFTKLSGGLQQVPLCHPAKFQLLSRKRSTRCALLNFFTFWLWGLTPGPKFTKRGDDLLHAQIYHPAIFHHPASIHVEDTHYKKSTDKQANTETVNDISPAFLWHVGIKTITENTCTVNRSHIVGNLLHVWFVTDLGHLLSITQRQHLTEGQVY